MKFLILASLIVSLNINAGEKSNNASMITYSPILFSAITAEAYLGKHFQNKEELVAVKADIVDYLADNAEASDALIKTIKGIKDRIPDTDGLTDKQIAAMVLASLK